jgi:hypothetical protein
VSGSATDCDDNDACTADSCVPITGCKNVLLPAEVVTSDLAIHLDASDPASFPGSGQTWFDLAGNNDFVLGKEPVPDPQDPTWDGEDFVFGTTSFFTKLGSNGAFINSLHKDSAQFTVIVWTKPSNVPSYYITMGTADNLGGTGFRWAAGPIAFFQVYAAPAGQLFGQIVYDAPAKQMLLGTGWQMIALSINESGNQGIAFNNHEPIPFGGQEIWPVTYSSPSSLDAPKLMRLGTQSNDGAATLPAGSRYRIVRMYSRALTLDELRQNYCAQKGSFGL